MEVNSVQPHNGRLSARCREAFDARDDQVFFANASVTSFIAAGAVAGVSLGYLIWAVSGDDDDGSATVTRLIPVVGSDTQGLLLQGSF